MLSISKIWQTLLLRNLGWHLPYKNLSKQKNKLYVTSTKGRNKEEKSTQYKLYRNKFHHLLRSAERKYYHDLLIEHKNNLKKSWKVIKSVINKRNYSPSSTKFKYIGNIIDGG